MKLIVAIIQNRDINQVMHVLIRNDYQFTNLATNGGFSRLGNSTLLIGCEEKRVRKAVEIIKDETRSTEDSYNVDLIDNNFASSGPMKVKIGQATIFVLDVDDFIKF